MAVTIASESLRLLFAMPVTDAITTMVMIGVRETNGRGSSNIWGMTVMIMTNAVEPMTVTPL